MRSPQSAPTSLSLHQNTSRFTGRLELRSVQSVVDDWTDPLHVLIDNAGIMTMPELERPPEDSTDFMGGYAAAAKLRNIPAAHLRFQ